MNWSRSAKSAVQRKKFFLFFFFSFCFRKTEKLLAFPSLSAAFSFSFSFLVSIFAAFFSAVLDCILSVQWTQCLCWKIMQRDDAIRYKNKMITIDFPRPRWLLYIFTNIIVLCGGLLNRIYILFLFFQINSNQLTHLVEKSNMLNRKLTSSNEYHIVCFATGRFYLSIDDNLCKTISVSEIKIIIYLRMKTENRFSRIQFIKNLHCACAN